MKATLPEPEIVTRNGKPVSVIIPIKDYEELLERVEDADDVASPARFFVHASRTTPSLRQMTRRPMSGRHFPQRRNLHPATLLGDRTARVKGATARRVDG